MVLWTPVDVPQGFPPPMEPDVPGQCHVEDDAASYVLVKAHLAENEEEEEDENLFAGADDRSVATVLDYFAEYSAAKERHDSGISGSPVSISDSEQLVAEGAVVDDTAPIEADTAQAKVKDKDVKNVGGIGDKDPAVISPSRAGRNGGGESAAGRQSRSRSGNRQADR
jgi:hypothetical protein